MKIAIASSGLGHITRGVETWARDTAETLHRLEVPVTLFAAGKVDVDVPLVVVPCLRRESATAELLVRILPKPCWRWGLKNVYGIEQLSFWRGMKKHLVEGDFDILHIQDPMAASWCRRARLRGEIKVKEVLAHGTEEPASFLRQFEYVQHLVPFHQESVLDELGMERVPDGWTVAPNFIDTERFSPVADLLHKKKIRQMLGIPPDGLLIGCAAAIKKGHKRLSYLIDEFAIFQKEHGDRGAHLVIAGAHEGETDAVIDYARRMLGDSVTFLVDYPFEKMPDFYRALDLFILPSLFEMMGIVLAEAMASGVPCIVHSHPVMMYVIGDGGISADLSQEGRLAKTVNELSPNKIDVMGRLARERAVEMFSSDMVVRQYIEYYRKILAC